MAEETLAPTPGGNRRIIYIIVGIVVIFSILFLFFIRSCGGGGGGAGYKVLYSNLDLKDSANVVARLKELKIPYEIKDDGTSVAVPKERADEARLGLAEKNLPIGGAVGWEIFDESKLGATDFDRRIQLIRAISGELARTIRRIAAVEDCRVQIVIPETRLFEVEKAPVTAAVLIKTVPGEKLLPSQVNGIVHLVASSVEKLDPKNVTIVDDYGNIMTVIPDKRRVEQKKELVEEAKKEILEIKEERLVGTPEATAETKVVLTDDQRKKEEELKKLEEELRKKEEELKKMSGKTSLEVATQPMTDEERHLLRLEAKKEYESQLTQKAQSILNQFYPPNSVIVKVSVELYPSKVNKDKVMVRDQLKEGLSIKRLHTVILVDNRLDLSKSLKKTTYATIAAAIGYHRERGDRIIIKRVPFHYAMQSQAAVTQAETKKERASWMTYVLLVYEFVVAKAGYRNFVIGVIGIFVFLIVLLIVRAIFGGRREREFEFGPPEFLDEEEEVPSEAVSKDALDTIGKIRGMADDDPARLAALLKRWLSEEGEPKE